MSRIGLPYSRRIMVLTHRHGAPGLMRTDDVRDAPALPVQRIRIGVELPFEQDVSNFNACCCRDCLSSPSTIN